MDNSIHNNQGFLSKTAQFLLIISFILCLGSISTFIVMNVILGNNPSITSIYWQRLFVSKITSTLIVPGLWMMIISGAYLSWKSNGFSKNIWITGIQLLIACAFINGMIIILPAADRVTAIAVHQVQQQVFLPEYTALKNKEDFFGMINFFIMVCILILFIYKPINK